MASLDVSTRPDVAAPESFATCDASSPLLNVQDKIEEYKKIVQFRDTVLAGEHPRIKVLLTKAVPDRLTTDDLDATSMDLPQPAGLQFVEAGDSNRVKENSQSFQANLQNPPVNLSATFPGLGMLPPTPNNHISRPMPSARPEIDPIFLEKSDDLIKAEIQLQRQRIERSLRDQIDHKRAALKVSQHGPESLADMDLADVWSKAKQLVLATKQAADDVAAPSHPESDSFDDDTFYSSRHDTSDISQQNLAGQVPSEDEQMREESYEPQLDSPLVMPMQIDSNVQPPIPDREPSVRLPHTGFVPDRPGDAFGAHLPGIPSVADRLMENLRAQVSPYTNETATRGDGAYRANNNHSTATHSYLPVSGTLLDQALRGPMSPVVRAHNLSPLAPQPEHVSPLALSRQPPVAQDASARQATPAQVAALRQAVSTGTTPDSSPQVGNRVEKKKRRKKARAERLAAQAAANSPQIKSEPQSPSPLSAPSFTRPNKRQRHNPPQQSVRNGEDHIMGNGGDESRYDFGGQNRAPSRMTNGRGRDIIPTIDLESPSYNSHLNGHANDLTNGHNSSYHASYAGFPDQRVAPSNGSAYGNEAPGRDAPAYAPEYRTASRASMHPTQLQPRSPRFAMPSETMPPPRAPTRILVDEYGREFMEPPRQPTAFRETSVHISRLGETDPRYGHAPQVPRAVSQRPDTLEQDGVLYRRVSPSYASAPRRVVTMPEAFAPDQRAYREPELSSRPMLPPSDGYGVQQARTTADIPHEYMMRAASARPEGVRYETTVGYERRPVEEMAREYLPPRAASTRPVDNIRYSVPTSYDGRTVHEAARDFGLLRAASVRPPGYEVVRDVGPRYSSVRPEMAQRDHAMGQPLQLQRDGMMPPTDARSYRARPLDSPALHQPVRQEYGARPLETFYAQPPAPRPEEEVVYYEYGAPAAYQ